MTIYFLLLFCATTKAFPITWLQTIDNPFMIPDIENYILDSKELNKISDVENGGSNPTHILDLRKTAKNDKRKSKMLKTLVDVLTDGAIEGVELVEDLMTTNPFSTSTLDVREEGDDFKTSDEVEKNQTSTTTTTIMSTMTTQTTTISTITENPSTNIIITSTELSSNLSTILPNLSNDTFQILNETEGSEKYRHTRQGFNETEGNERNRHVRQEDDDNNGGEEDNATEATQTDDPRGARQNAASEEDDSSSEEDGGNAVTGLISAFLGGLSKPDGGIDLDAIVGLLGGLSKQNDDGTYDFNGLTELLMGFFGPDEAGGGGSDVGQFVGALVGALVKGVANPPGAKGAGVFTGKILNGVLPALSAPAPPAADGETNTKPSPGLDSGGFLSGLLGTILGPFSSASSGGGGGGSGNFKFSLFKSVFSLITSLLTSASSASSSSKG